MVRRADEHEYRRHESDVGVLWRAPPSEARLLRAGTVILVGAVYLVVGLIFGALAGSAASHQVVVMWRPAAWVISAAAFGAHVWHEHFRLRNSPRITAWHASAAVALGAFGLAGAARVHAPVTRSGNPHLLSLPPRSWPGPGRLPALV